MSNIDEGNLHCVLISGESSTGKSASLMNMREPESVVYLNCEHKRLPFKSKFKEIMMLDPHSVPQAIEQVESKDKFKTVVVDTLTYMMDMYETQYVLTSTDTRSAWGTYSQFWKSLRTGPVAKSSKNVIFLAHTLKEIDGEGVPSSAVKVKGALMNTGIESYFSIVINTVKMAIRDLKEYDNPLLTITEEDEIVGFKYVFQTRLTRATKNDRIRSPVGMWDVKETYINNDVQLVIDRLNAYYGEG